MLHVNPLEGFEPPDVIQDTHLQEGWGHWLQKPSAYICNITHGQGKSTRCTNTPAYPHGVQVLSHNQVIPPEDSAASGLLQETVLLASVDFSNMEVEFEGVSNGPLELAIATSLNAENDLKSIEHANGWMTGLSGTHLSRKSLTYTENSTHGC